MIHKIGNNKEIEMKKFFVLFFILTGVGCSQSIGFDSTIKIDHIIYIISVITAMGFYISTVKHNSDEIQKKVDVDIYAKDMVQIQKIEPAIARLTDAINELKI